ncbi:MAG TPA: hypothetical protein VN924_18090 [Bryobacteraceae bacterium]|jgi:hypothetical protein|nr:hypothetical protein [Bryobacteraceae bacterium]
MSREEIQKLLGGYATDTLSEAERSALFEAALDDQDLFDALAKEQALRDVLGEPDVRRQLIAALGPARAPLRWLRKPAVLATAGSLAALAIVAALVVRQTRLATQPEAMVADAIAPRPPVAMPPSASALRAPEPAVATHQPKRLARLPAGRALPVPQPAATAAPSPPPAVSPARAQAAGALAGTAGGPRQTVEVTGQSFVAQQQAPMPAMPRAKAATAAVAKRAVNYTLLLKDADGAYSPVPSDTVFHAGDSVRVQVVPTEAGYVYLFQRDDAAAWTLVASQRVEMGQRYELPSTGGVQSKVPAQLELLLMLSRVEHVDVDAQATPTMVIEYR